MSDIFKDDKDRAWRLKLSYGVVKRVKDKTGINLAKPGQNLPPGAELQDVPEEKLPLPLRLANDQLLLLEIVFAMIEPQAIQESVSEEEFVASMSPKTFKQAHDIFWELYHAFFQESGNPIQAKMISMIRGALGRLEGKMEMLDDRIEQRMQQVEEELEQQIQQTT